MQAFVQEKASVVTLIYFILVREYRKYLTMVRILLIRCSWLISQDLISSVRIYRL